MKYEEMNKADLLKVISALEDKLARRSAPVVYTVSKTPHTDLLHFLTGRRLEIWNIVSKMPAGKPFSINDILAAYKALPNTKLDTKDGGKGALRLAVSFLTKTAFLVAAKPEVKSKPEAKQLKTVAA